jgi:hypothetical protein
MAISADLLGDRWHVIDSPEPLYDDEGDRCKAQVDHEQSTIWIDPDVPPADRPQALLSAVCFAVNQRFRPVPIVE